MFRRFAVVIVAVVVAVGLAGVAAAAGQHVRPHQKWTYEEDAFGSPGCAVVTIGNNNKWHADEGLSDAKGTYTGGGTSVTLTVSGSFTFVGTWSTSPKEYSGTTTTNSGASYAALLVKGAQTSYLGAPC